MTKLRPIEGKLLKPLKKQVIRLRSIFEFFMRLVFSPKYAPYMMIASFIVGDQKEEWVEAKPKKFAWDVRYIIF